MINSTHFDIVVRSLTDKEIHQRSRIELYNWNINIYNYKIEHEHTWMNIQSSEVVRCPWNVDFFLDLFLSEYKDYRKTFEVNI